MKELIVRQYIADAFTDTVFKGNPAAICLLQNWISDEMMQNIAKENRLSETAFTVKKDQDYELRWFTPGGEIDLCGHATLGTAYILFNFIEKDREDIVFHTVRKGLLSIVERSDFSKEEQNQFNTRPIASLVELKDHSSSQFDFEKGYGGDWIIVQYLKKVKASNPDITAGELNELRKELYPNGSKKLLEEEFGKVQ